MQKALWVKNAADVLFISACLMESQAESVQANSRLHIQNFLSFSDAAVTDHETVRY